MNKLNKQEINILKIIFSNTRRRISLFVSLILILVLSGALASSFFLSVSTLNKLAKSNYFQNKIMQFLKEKVHNNDIILIKCSNSTKINKFAKILLKQVSI